MGTILDDSSFPFHPGDENVWEFEELTFGFKDVNVHAWWTRKISITLVEVQNGSKTRPVSVEEVLIRF